MHAVTALVISLILIGVVSFIAAMLLAKRNKKRSAAEHSDWRVMILMALSFACIFGSIFIGVPRLPVS